MPKQNIELDPPLALYEDDFNELVSSHPDSKIFITYTAHKDCMRVMTRKPGDLQQIVDAFKEVNDSSFFQQRYTSRTLENYNYSVSPFGYFQPGLFKTILKFIMENDYINPMREPASKFLCISPGAMRYAQDWLFPLSKDVKEYLAKNFDEFNVENISFDRQDEPMVMRDYQEEAIRTIICEGFGRGLIESATGSGKSFMIANLIYTLRMMKWPKPKARVLIYVPNIQLVEQFYSDLISYGFREDELCKCSGSLSTKEKKYLDEHGKKSWIVIANSAWCNNHLAELGKLDILIVDEAHRMTPGSKGFNNIRERLRNTKIRVGFTGTLPNGYNLWELEGLMGPIVYKATVTDLQNAGYLANLQIVKIKVTDNAVENNEDFLFNIHSKWKLDEFNEDTGDLIGANDAWVAEQEWEVQECERIFSPVVQLLLGQEECKNENTLILFDRIALGKKMYESFISAIDTFHSEGFTPLYIDGSTAVDEREKIRKSLETSNGNILLGQSSILSTGINIKNLKRIVLLTGGKAQARIIQAIGRTLRLSAGKDYSQLYDVEVSYKYSKRHARERKKLYKLWYGKNTFDEEYEFTV